MEKELTTDNLTLFERLIIPSLLKKEGNFKTLIINDDLKKKVVLAQDEFTKYEIVFSNEGTVSWNAEGAAASFPYVFTELERNELKLSLEELNRENKLSIDHISLYKKFVIN